VGVSTEADDAVNWNNAVQLCRSGPGLYPTLASVQSLLETGNMKQKTKKAIANFCCAHSSTFSEKGDSGAKQLGLVVATFNNYAI
jgi:hypothetical protein